MDRILRFPSLFFRQKLNAVGIPVLIGVLLFLYLPAAAILVSLSALATLLLSLFIGGEDRVTLRLLSLGFALSLILWGGVGLKEKTLVARCDRPYAATGYVLAVEEGKATLALTSLDHRPFFETVSVPAEDLSCGQKRSLTLRLSTVYPEKERAEGVSLSGTLVDSGTVTGKSYLYTAVGLLRDRVMDYFSTFEEGPFLSATLLGVRRDLSEADTEAFRRTASSHILAISGLHLSLTVSYLLLFLRRLGLSGRAIRLCLYPAVLCLFLFSGASLSAFRAAVMTLFATTGHLLRRRSDSTTALVFSAVLLVLLDPFAPESPSFQLSYLCTFGMVTCAAPFSDHLTNFVGKGREERLLTRISSALLSSFAVTLVSFCFSLPVTLLLFEEVQLLAPLYAPLLVTLFQPCLGATLLLAVCAFFPRLPAFLPHLLSLVPRMYLALVHALADGAPPAMEGGFLTVPLAALFALVLGYFFLRKRPLTDLLILYLALVIAFLAIAAFRTLFAP